MVIEYVRSLGIIFYHIIKSTRLAMIKKDLEISQLQLRLARAGLS